MKRIMTIPIALTLILISGLGVVATASVDLGQGQDSTLIGQRTDDCKGDPNDPCTGSGQS
jgi:hypothetical protein